MRKNQFFPKNLRFPKHSTLFLAGTLGLMLGACKDGPNARGGSSTPTVSDSEVTAGDATASDSSTPGSDGSPSESTTADSANQDFTTLAQISTFEPELKGSNRLAEILKILENMNISASSGRDFSEIRIVSGPSQNTDEFGVLRINVAASAEEIRDLITKQKKASSKILKAQLEAWHSLVMSKIPVYQDSQGNTYPAFQVVPSSVLEKSASYIKNFTRALKTLNKMDLGSLDKRYVGGLVITVAVDGKRRSQNSAYVQFDSSAAKMADQIQDFVITKVSLTK